ncbi:DENN domain-containing protein 3 [Collichthys lucidus]|uniref:DENN domain-containing protein 3 n=1 Tax=Collichthys lucidus TaxID=240159 RepID=A0A4U5V675_COLLU|nr:DENN domain-containing protein 3 [Collichthys lucidus]
MADHLPPVLLEACVVVGASNDKLQEISQAINNNGTPKHLLLEPEVLHVLAPPFVSKPQAENELVRSHGRRRRSFLRKKREQPPSVAATPSQDGRGGSVEVIVPKDIDLMALPQLCFPGGLQVTKEEKDEQFHFLVFTDVFGNKSHGVVMQYYRPILEEASFFQNHGSFKFSKLFSAYSLCVISKYPYFTALKDCLSCLLIQLRTCRLSDMEERVKEFAAKLALVPIPPPGQLHLMFTLCPLTIVLPSQEDKDHPAIDLDLHLPFFCFRPQQLLRVLSCLLQEQRVVLFSADWARLTLVAESLLLFLQPLSWQQPYVPVLARGMLDFLMAPTAFLMGCHLSHLEEVAAETDDLILINIDNGSVSTSCSEIVDLPEIPPAAADCFTQRMKGMVEIPRRPTMQEIQARRKSSFTESRLSKRLGTSLPNLGDDQTISFQKNTLLTGIVISDPDFPVSLSFHSVQNYYSELIQQLGKAIFSVQNENPTLLARFYYLRGFINTLCSRRLDALADFQNLYKTDTAIFPTQLVTWLMDSLHRDERQQADRRPELKRLILKVKTENEKLLVRPDDHVKKFKLPRKHLHQEEFVRCVQECGIVKDVATIHRLFDALTDGQPKKVDPELFKVFYTFWKEMEIEAQDVNLPSGVIDHLDNSECVYKLSSCVKTSYGVGKIAMTQKRLFLLTEGRPGFLDITKFRDIQEVKIASAPFLLLRIPSLRIQTSRRPEVFEANLKTETELWNLVVKEMWAGRKMADQHKGCLQTQRSIIAASKLAYFDKIKHEVPMMVPKTTSETLKHKINPSLDLAEPQTVHVLLYTPGHLTYNDSGGMMNPKLWVALSGGKVVVFDAASWSMLQDCIQVGESQLNCMLGLVQEQVWIGSQDSVIYIIDTHSMSCNKQLTEHRHEVTGLTMDTRDQQHSSQQTYSCSCDGTILQWDSASLKVKRQFYLSCDRLSSIQIHNGTLWCCIFTSSCKLQVNYKTY